MSGIQFTQTLQSGLTFEEEPHLYRWNGSIVPSVTTINSAVKVVKDNRMLDIGGSSFSHNENAANFGSAFHKVVASILRLEEVEYPDALKPYVEQFCKFYDQWLVIAIADTKKRYVIDWKTSTTFQPYWRRQIAAYAEIARYALRKYPVDVSYLVECPMYHEIYRYCGTPDLVCGNLKGSAPTEQWSVKFDADKFTVDFRSSKKNPEDWNEFQSILNVYNMAA
jgi:hypothetical protein